MTLQRWAEYGWLRLHASSRQEIADLQAIADRDISDARSGGISTDWQFGIAYNAALKLCTHTYLCRRIPCRPGVTTLQDYTGITSDTW